MCCRERDQNFHPRAGRGMDDELPSDLRHSFLHADQPEAVSLVAKIKTAAVIHQAQLDFGRTKAEHRGKLSRARVFDRVRERLLSDPKERVLPRWDDGARIPFDAE